MLLSANIDLKDFEVAFKPFAPVLNHKELLEDVCELPDPLPFLIFVQETVSLQYINLQDGNLVFVKLFEIETNCKQIKRF